MDTTDISIENGHKGTESAECPTPPGTPTSASVDAPPNEYSDIPQVDWLTRDEAAKVIEKSIKTIDRYLCKGYLERRDTRGPVWISRVSIERLLQRKLVARPERPKILLEAEHYDAMLLRLQYLERRDRLLLSCQQREVEHRQREAELVSKLVAETERVAGKQRDLISAVEIIKAERQRVAALEKEHCQIAEEMQRMAAEREKLIEALEQEKNRTFWQRLLGWLQ